jgi:hypothetical protein
VVVAHLAGPPDGCVHAAGGLALLLANLGGVDGLAAAGQVERGGEQADGVARGSWGHRNAPGVG